MSGGDYYNCSRKAYHILRRKIQRAVSIRVQRIAIENEARALISQADVKESTRPCAMTIDADDVSDNNCVQDELEHVPSLMDEGDVSNEDDIDDDCSSDVSSSADVTTSCSDDDEYNYTDSDDRSDDGKSSDQCDEASLKQDMLAWYMKFNVKQDALTALLHILREHGVAGLPLDARTLVGTPQNITLQQIAGGEYHYFGIADTLRHVLSSHTLSQGQVLQLQINMDGLPVYKSVKSDLWPILGLLFHKGSVFISEPFCIGVYYGPSKPTSAHDYVRQFVEEFNLLHKVSKLTESLYACSSIPQYVTAQQRHLLSLLYHSMLIMAATNAKQRANTANQHVECHFQTSMRRHVPTKVSRKRPIDSITS